MLIIFNIIIVILAWISPKEFIYPYGGYFYLLQFVVFLVHLLKNTGAKYRVLYLLSPSFISITYLSLSLGFGAISLANGLGFESNFIAYYSRIADHLSYINAYFLLCNFLVYFSLVKNIYPFDFPEDEKPKEIVTDRGFYAAIFIFICFSVVDFDLSFIGGSGTFSYMPRLVASIFIVIYMSRYKMLYRVMLYALLMFAFTLTEFESKRQLLFVLILIIWCEFTFHPIKIKFNFKIAFLLLLGMGLFTYLIVISSILRGYGGFNVTGVGDANKHVIEYVTSQAFKDGSVTNFEVNAVYGNSANAVNYLITDQDNYLYGTTFMKVLFLPLPKDFIISKPEAMIDIYTRKADIGMFRNGVSYPIIFYSELYWNFWLLGLLLLYPLYYWFNRCYFTAFYKLKNGEINFFTVSVIFFYLTFIQFVRGSGLHLWILYYLITVPFILLLIKINAGTKTPALYPQDEYHFE